ncbi:MAG: RNA polymerase sigma factor for flagellar operon, partial [uncultured bacterium]
REPTDQEVCHKMNIDLDTCHRLRAEANGARQISLDDYHSHVDTMEGILRKTLNMINPRTPEGLIHVKEVREILAEEIDDLSDRERQVVSLYYLEEMTLKEIGAVLSITESRVSQIHAQALGRLMNRLKVSFGTDSPDSDDYDV